MFSKKLSGRTIRPKRQQPASTYSYYSNRTSTPVDQPRRVEPSQRRFQAPANWWHHLPTMLAGIAILGCLIYSLILSSNPIVIQSTLGNNVFLRSKNAYQQAAQQLFKKSIFNANKITVNVSGITADLKKQFPELADVSITIPIISHRPVVYLTPSQPAIILKAVNGSFVLNQAGVAAADATKLVGLKDIQIPNVEDHTNLNIRLGKAVLPASQADFITTVYQQIMAQKQSVQSFVLPLIPNELDITPAGSKYFIKMDMQADAKEQAGTMLAMLGYLKAKSITPTSYVDVRVSGRAYYK